ncbi:MAG: hypothetical protein GAK30_03655 [Paracidovorax wautersii]|uniref:LysR substrate-binding domain-containing protein n=1 Tax=Paracidovorax wautersii TaxID=1177982 RepID=A0A7V8JNZ3_9BURK|nr:MAG: hypothetical protein GAK30_03655 [Paracidovorax wautersii]
MDLETARWVFTAAQGESGYAKLLFESHGLQPPPIGAVVNSTLALMSLVATGDYVALMPAQIAQHPMAASYVGIVLIEEQGHELEIGAILRHEAVVSPLLRHLMAHLHRAAHQAVQQPVRL